jgi:hypothetical protein
MITDLTLGLLLTGVLFLGIIFLVKFLCEAAEWLHEKTK